MTKTLKNNFFLILSLLLVTIFLMLNIDNSFFWDTVQLGSIHASFYSDTNFSTLWLSDDFDSGHIPAFGIYIALIWEIFGRTLEVSHLAMLPFALGIVYQLHRLCHRFINPEYSGIAMFLILIDPTLLSQMTLVSPDVPLVFFFLMGLNAVLSNRKLLIVISIILLFLTSMRGMMVSICLLILDLYLNMGFANFRDRLFAFVKRSFLYLPALLIFITYNIFHYLEKGWIGYHENSPWADCFATVDLNGFLFNIGILGWRIIDFGRIGVWVIFSILLIIYHREIFKEKQTRILFLFFICIMILLPSNMLWAKNLLAHRYLLPIYLIFALLCANVLFSAYVDRKLKYALSGFWIIMLLTGNLWIYPPKISKGWDSTLAHLPYYGLRHEAISYLDKEQINFKDVHTFFPNTASLDKIDLNNDTRNFDTYDGSSKYVFYSNIFNIDDQTFDRITNFDVVKHFENNGVFITIYKDPDYTVR